MEERLAPKDQPAGEDVLGQDDRQELENLRLKCEEYLNGWKRAKADFINYQKDEISRFGQILKFGNESLIRDLLVVLDSFDLALAAHPTEKGFYLVQSQLEDLLKKNGLEKLKVSAGDVFDPSIHQSVAEVEPPVEGRPSNTVAEEVEKGYTLGGKVIRAAKVKIFK